jgi:hypothetical protein
LEKLRIVDLALAESEVVACPLLPAGRGDQCVVQVDLTYPFSMLLQETQLTAALQGQVPDVPANANTVLLYEGERQVKERILQVLDAQFCRIDDLAQGCQAAARLPHERVHDCLVLGRVLELRDNLPGCKAPQMQDIAMDIDCPCDLCGLAQTGKAGLADWLVEARRFYPQERQMNRAYKPKLLLQVRYRRVKARVEQLGIDGMEI